MAVVRLTCALAASDDKLIQEHSDIQTLEELTSEVLFGPLRDRVCACGRCDARAPGGGRMYLAICDACGVTAGPRSMRATSFGAIVLSKPVPHPWWPGRSLRFVPVTPPDWRDAESPMRVSYARLLVLRAVHAQELVIATVAGLFGASPSLPTPSAAIVSDSGADVAASSLRDLGELMIRALAACPVVDITGSATVSGLLDGTAALLLDDVVLGAKPTTNEPPSVFRRSTAQLIDDVNAGIPTALPRPFSFLLSCVDVLGATARLALVDADD